MPNEVPRLQPAQHARAPGVHGAHGAGIALWWRSSYVSRFANGFASALVRTGSTRLVRKVLTRNVQQRDREVYASRLTTAGAARDGRPQGRIYVVILLGHPDLPPWQRCSVA
jgi:hypothetical protein